MSSNFEPLVYLNFLSSEKIDKVIYLDRDGVLLKPVIREEEISSARIKLEVCIYDDVETFGREAKSLGYTLVVVSNQPDISRGIVSKTFLKWTNRKLSEVIPIDYYIYCTHQASMNCMCRKPKIGMISYFRSIHMSKGASEIMVGDRIVDYQLAQKIGIDFILRNQTYNCSIDSAVNFLNVPRINNLNDIWTIIKDVRC